MRMAGISTLVCLLHRRLTAQLLDLTLHHLTKTEWLDPCKLSEIQSFALNKRLGNSKTRFQDTPKIYT